jgi:hypothetical protein
MGLAISLIPYFIHINKVKEVEIVHIKKKRFFKNKEYVAIPLDDKKT